MSRVLCIAVYSKQISINTGTLFCQLGDLRLASSLAFWGVIVVKLLWWMLSLISCGNCLLDLVISLKFINTVSGWFRGQQLRFSFFSTRLAGKTTTATTILRPFSGTTRVSRCQEKTSGLYGAREDWQRQTHRPSGWEPLHPDQPVLTSTIPPLLFTGRMPFLLPNQQCQSTEGLAHSDLGEDARVLLNGVTCTVSVPCAPSPYLDWLERTSLKWPYVVLSGM